jgi:hypothetical protein
MMREMTMDNDVEHPNNLLSLAQLELLDDSVNMFCSIINDAYIISFEMEYSGFVVMGGYLLKRKCIRDIYGSMILLFPFIHSLFAMTAWLTGPRGDQASLS